ncbi:hypothetical protein [Streptococcus merionis]|uniref:hypothetical protein n=1 Tax=Streptococcus merionis TaxID=400065 RepID=UPI003515EE19
MLEIGAILLFIGTGYLLYGIKRGFRRFVDKSQTKFENKMAKRKEAINQTDKREKL